MMLKFLLPGLLLLISCSRPEVCVDPVHLRWADQNESIDALYNDSVTLIRKKDTTITISHRYDTTIIETGMFSYLQHDFEMVYQFHRFTDIFRLVRQAESNRDSVRIQHLYDSAIYFYNHQRPLDLELFSDLNGYYMYETNAAILCSDAYEKTGNLNDAIKVLSPSMANVETNGTKIQLRFIELCLKKYGKEKVREEIEHSKLTLNYTKEGFQRGWQIKVFGGNLGIGRS